MQPDSQVTTVGNRSCGNGTRFSPCPRLAADLLALELHRASSLFLQLDLESNGSPDLQFSFGSFASWGGKAKMEDRVVAQVLIKAAFGWFGIPVWPHRCLVCCCITLNKHHDPLPCVQDLSGMDAFAGASRVVLLGVFDGEEAQIPALLVLGSATRLHEVQPCTASPLRCSATVYISLPAQVTMVTRLLSTCRHTLCRGCLMSWRP
jgi:hypothetical protein